MRNEKIGLAIVTIVLGGIGILLSWIPLINNLAAVFAIVGFITGIISLILNRKKKKRLSSIGLMISILAFIIVIVTQTIYSNEIKKSIHSPSVSSAYKVPKKSEEKKVSLVTTMNQFAANSKSVPEIYITGNMTIGKDQPIKPGIYDLTVTGGSGNITGERKMINGMFINWTAAATGGEFNDYPSTIRIILFEGDTLSFRDISKIKLTAITEKVTPSNQLGIGNYVVGRDIPAGTYKLSTNITMNPKFENLGWDINIYNDDTQQSQDQTLLPKNMDVAVTLKEGEIITTTFDNTQDGVPTDSARLIFTPVN